MSNTFSSLEKEVFFKRLLPITSIASTSRKSSAVGLIKVRLFLSLKNKSPSAKLVIIANVLFFSSTALDLASSTSSNIFKRAR